MHGLVKKAACIVAGAEASKRSLHAYVTLKLKNDEINETTGSDFAQSLIDHVSKHEQAYLVPRIIHIIDSMPLSGNGKVLKNALSKCPVVYLHERKSKKGGKMNAKHTQMISLWTSAIGKEIDEEEENLHSGMDFFSDFGGASSSHNFQNRKSEEYSLASPSEKKGNSRVFLEYFPRL